MDAQCISNTTRVCLKAMEKHFFLLVGLRSLPSGFGRAGLLQCGSACASVSAGGNSSRGLHSGVGGLGSWVAGLCVGGVCGSPGGLGVLWGVGLLAADVCGLPGVEGGEACLAGGSVAGVCGRSGGGGGPVLREPGLCPSVGACGRLGGEWGGRGRGCGAGFACGVSVYVFACRGAFVWSRVGWEVWRRSLPSSAAAARISQMHVRIWCTSWSVVGRGYFRGGLRPMRRRTLWTAWYPQVRGSCGLGGGVLPHVGARLYLCVRGGDGPDPGLGPCGRPAPLDPLGQAEQGQSQVVACPPRGDLSQGAGWGLVQQTSRT